MVDLTKGFDLRAAAERGAWLQVLHPVTGEELGVAEGAPCRICIKGADSMSYEEAAARTVALRSKDIQPNAKRKVTTKRLLEASDKLGQAQSEEMAAVTLGWENVEWNGEPLEFTQENAIMVYSEHRWIREQVMEFFGDRANYQGNA